jgi:hypothetical protein
MSKSVQDDQWVWVVVEDPGGNEQFLGMEDGEKKESFIPAFLEKEEAQQGLSHLPRHKDKTYEVQAIRLDDLAFRAAQQGFQVFLLKGSGEIIEKIASH